MSSDILNRKPFDLQESVVLLDVYVSLCKKGVSQTDAAKIASDRLRDLAKKRGMTIDDAFRSQAGVQNRLRSIGHIFEGKESASSPGTQMFRNAVGLYLDDKKKYDELLKDASSDSPIWEDASVPKAKRKAIDKAKFVKTRKDESLKEQYGDSFNKVYYVLKQGSGKITSGLTATDIFINLDRQIQQKDIIDILENASWSQKIRDSHYQFYDKEQEARKQKQMDEILKAAEQNFLTWLPSTMPPYAVQDIINSYKSISAMLVQKKALPQTLFATTQIDQIEYALRQVKGIFGSKKTRVISQKLLTAYLSYLEEKKNTAPAEPKPAIEIQENWLKFDFTNSSQFEKTAPAYCSVKGTEFGAKTWARILVELVEHEIANNNPTLDILYKQPLLANRNDRPFLLMKKIEGLNCTELSNGYWLNINYGIPRLMELIQAFLLHCGYSKNDVSIYGMPKESASTAKRDTSAAKSSGNGVSIEKAEAFLQAAELNGATVQEIINAVQPGAAFSPTRITLDESPNCIAMPNGRYVHTDAFIDLDVAKETMTKILQTHFAQFGGYSNSKLLFGAASHDLSLFLNDNDCEDADSVYALAQYFFGKNKEDAVYTFSYPHIFEKNPDFPPTLKGLMINLARANDGVLRSEDAKNYLDKTMLSYGSLGQLLQRSSSDTFLYYDENRFLLTEKIGIDANWIQAFHDKLDALFRQADVAYVIPRDIKDNWLNTLPSLPQGLPWTILLLQEVLRNFPDIGFRPITAQLSQASDTIAAAIAPAESVLQTFPDIVTLYMQEKYTLPRRMACEELRQILLEAGMLEGGELIYAMHKALNDFRFVWTDENKSVLVRGN